MQTMFYTRFDFYRHLARLENLMTENNDIGCVLREVSLLYCKEKHLVCR